MRGSPRIWRKTAVFKTGRVRCRRERSDIAFVTFGIVARYHIGVLPRMRRQIADFREPSIFVGVAWDRALKGFGVTYELMDMPHFAADSEKFENCGFSAALGSKNPEAAKLTF